METNDSRVNFKSRSNWLDKLFMLTIVLAPIFEHYQSPLPYFNLSTFLLFPMLLILLVLKRKMTLPPAGIVVYVLFIISNLVITETMSGNVLSFFRTLLWIVTYFCFAKFCFCTETYFELLGKVLLISVLLMTVQFVAYYGLHVRIRFRIDGLLRSTEYLSHSSTVALRPSGIYMEPAHFTICAVQYLIYVLFGTGEKIESHPDWKSIVIVTMGIIMSGSGQGYVFLVMVYAMWFLVYLKESKAKTKYMVIIAVFILCLFAVAFISNTSLGQYAISRIMPDSKHGFGGEALAGRMYAIKRLDTLRAEQKWFGIGAYSKSDYTQAYMTSYIAVQYTLGYLGLVCFGIMLLLTFRQKKGYVRYAVILFCLMFVLSDVHNISWITFYFLPWLLSEDYNHRRKYRIKIVTNRNRFMP